MAKFSFHKTGKDRYGSPEYSNRDIASLGILFGSYFWLMLSIVLHVWVWQGTHQGISEYGVFVYFWWFFTIALGALLIWAIITILEKEDEEV